MLADGQTDRLTDRQIHWLTDANRFYNLSHAICYSYGTDNYPQQYCTYSTFPRCRQYFFKITYLNFLSTGWLLLLPWLRVAEECPVQETGVLSLYAINEVDAATGYGPRRESQSHRSHGQREQGPRTFRQTASERRQLQQHGTSTDEDLHTVGDATSKCYQGTWEDRRRRRHKARMDAGSCGRRSHAIPYFQHSLHRRNRSILYDLLFKPMTCDRTTNLV